VSIAVYFLMSALIVADLIGLTIRLAITRSLGRDDFLSVGAMDHLVAQILPSTANPDIVGCGYWSVYRDLESHPRWFGKEGKYA
jgi:hypothetical protein